MKDQAQAMANFLARMANQPQGAVTGANPVTQPTGPNGETDFYYGPNGITWYSGNPTSNIIPTTVPGRTPAAPVSGNAPPVGQSYAPGSMPWLIQQQNQGNPGTIKLPTTPSGPGDKAAGEKPIIVDPTGRGGVTGGGRDRGGINVADPIDQGRRPYVPNHLTSPAGTYVDSPAGTNNYNPRNPDVTGGFSAGQRAYAERMANYGGDPSGKATTVEVAPPDYETFSEFSDAAYDASRRYLDPTLERMRNQYEQGLINKGIDPNSEQGQEALTRYMTQVSDLESKASYDALREGAGYQQQLWEQGFGESQLANALLRAQIASQAQMYGADRSAGASMYGADRGLEGLLARLDETGRQFDLGLGQRESEFGRTLGQRESEFSRNYGLDRDRFSEGQYQFDRQADLAEMLGYANVDAMYADLGLRADDLQFRRDSREMDDFWRFLAGLPVQTTGPYAANQGAAAAGAAGGARRGGNLFDFFRQNWPGGG